MTKEALKSKSNMTKDVALKWAHDLLDCWSRGCKPTDYCREIGDAQAAIKAALAQPVQPVADFDTWFKNPYTLVLQKSIDVDYVPQPVQPVQLANDKLLQIIAAAYQIAGAYDAPAYILDVLANPEGATLAQIDELLPFVQPVQERLIGCVNHDCQHCVKKQPNEADELLTALGIDPDTYRTDGGWLNIPKIMAAIKNPQDYPHLEHVFDGRECWCNPEVNYVDPKTGVAVIVHREPVQPAIERNFCGRCGKRLGGDDYIHTCTPPIRTKEKL
jgi:hypothetical protein